MSKKLVEKYDDNPGAYFGMLAESLLDEDSYSSNGSDNRQVNFSNGSYAGKSEWSSNSKYGSSGKSYSDDWGNKKYQTTDKDKASDSYYKNNQKAQDDMKKNGNAVEEISKLSKDVADYTERKMETVQINGSSVQCKGVGDINNFKKRLLKHGYKEEKASGDWNSIFTNDKISNAKLGITNKGAVVLFYQNPQKESLTESFEYVDDNPGAYFGMLVENWGNLNEDEKNLRNWIEKKVGKQMSNMKPTKIGYRHGRPYYSVDFVDGTSDDYFIDFDKKEIEKCESLKEDKFVPQDKMSKKAQKEFNDKKRGTWGNTNPITRVQPNKKAYDRKRDKKIEDGSLQESIKNISDALDDFTDITGISLNGDEDTGFYFEEYDDAQSLADFLEENGFSSNVIELDEDDYYANDFSFIVEIENEFNSKDNNKEVKFGDFKIKDGVLLDYSGKDENVVIPNNVKYITSKAFAGKRFLKNIIFPRTLKGFYSHAFTKCTGLVDIVLPKNLELIDEFAFADCSSLTSITIPDSVEVIGDYAFSYCRSLKSISIPSSIRYIGYNAFFDCDSLLDIYYSGSEEDFENIKIKGKKLSNANIHFNSINESLEESVLNESSDGWDESKLYDLSEILDEIYNLQYEVQNTIRGAYTNAHTYEELGYYVHNLGSNLMDVGDEIMEMEEEDEEDED